MKRVGLIVLLLLVLVATAEAEVVSKIAAVVNQEIITTHQLDLKLANALASQAQGKIVPPEQMQSMRLEFLNRLIEEELVQQKIKELKLTASDIEVDDAIKDVQRQNKITHEQLVAALESQGMTFDEYKQKMRDQILRYKLIGREVQSKIDVTDKDVSDYFRDHIDDYREPPTIRLSQLLIPLPADASSSQIEAAKGKAAEALAQLRGGADFDAVAPTIEGAVSGSMGSFKERELSPLIREALAGKEAGSYSDVVDTPNGLMIFHIDDRTPGSIRNFDEVKIEIRQQLTDKDREERFKAWTQDLRKNAYIDIRL